MALYLNGQKIKINLGGVTYNLRLADFALKGVKLQTQSGEVIRDANGMFITAKKEEL